MDFNKKCLLITGGTGSFGNAVLRQFLNTGISEIRIFSRDEKKQDDMRQFYKNPKIKYFIGDVRNRQSIDHAMQGVDYVFHAAALKQVPSCEFFPTEAVRTNVLGCENVLDSAMQHKVKRVIVLSTDKAVYPINAMGMSKALSEKVMVAKSQVIEWNWYCILRYKIWKCHGLTRFSDTAVCKPDKNQSAHYHHRSQHDPVYDDAGRCCGTGIVCL